MLFQPSLRFVSIAGAYPKEARLKGRLQALLRNIRLGWKAGWPDWATFHQLGNFWKLIVFFFERMEEPKA
jgi:hypothetical protein